jgi:hypothetical protein
MILGRFCEFRREASFEDNFGFDAFWIESLLADTRHICFFENFFNVHFFKMPTCSYLFSTAILSSLCWVLRLHSHYSIHYWINAYIIGHWFWGSEGFFLQLWLLKVYFFLLFIKILIDGYITWPCSDWALKACFRLFDL